MQMGPIRMAPGVYWVGSMDWDRRLFDEFIPLPDGTSYNSYLLKGEEKVALIDGVDPTKEGELMENLEALGVKRLDYIVSNHAEQDHSGAIPRVLEAYPEAKVVTNAKCASLLKDLLHIPTDRFLLVGEGDELALGGKTLEFYLTPWAHWPETMVTYLKEDRILFTCDLFGAHLATSSIFAEEGDRLLDDAKRYYAEIMMPFRMTIRKNLEKVSKLDVGFIAPSHGPVYRDPSFILDAYRDWVSDDVKNEVVIPYVSMHGSTRKMVSYFVGKLVERGIKAKPFNLTKSDLGELAMALVDAATVVIGTPMVLTGVHPLVLYAAYVVKLLRPKARFLSMIGSYGWGGRFAEQLQETLKGLKAEFIKPVIVKGYPREEDFKELERLADDIKERHELVVKR